MGPVLVGALASWTESGAILVTDSVEGCTKSGSNRPRMHQRRTSHDSAKFADVFDVSPIISALMDDRGDLGIVGFQVSHLGLGTFYFFAAHPLLCA